MQVFEDNMSPTMYPAGLGLEPFNGWSFMVPTDLPEKGPINELDLFFLDQSISVEPSYPRNRSETFASSLSIGESIITDSPSAGSDSYFPAVFAQFDEEDQPSQGLSQHPQPLKSSLSRQKPSLQIQTQIDDTNRSQSVPARGVLIPSDPLEVDSKLRRREQNRKAQTVFRQKRKHEVRRLQQEIAELKVQLAGTHQSSCASWTVCAKCRNIYPRSSMSERGDESGRGSIHYDHLLPEV